MRKMPVLFIGHGSPMNIIQTNAYTDSLKKLGESLPGPKSICVFSAHWQTSGTLIHCEDTAKQIYDFYGFPDELYNIVYQPKGHSETAVRAAGRAGLTCDGSWGSDHAAWSVLKHMYPKADIPVFYISSDMTADYHTHYEISSSLKPFREEGVLFIGSGNIVHNLRDADFHNTDAEPDERGVLFDRQIEKALLEHDHNIIKDPMSLGTYVRYSIPTRDHYIPFVHACGLADDTDQVSFPCSIFQNRSVSMRSVLFE
ncbi:MAG: dioxygenase [Deferribacterales bacterium]